VSNEVTTPETMDVAVKTASETVTRAVQMNRSPAPEHHTVYANNSRIVSNFFDARIIFGEVTEATAEYVNVLDKATVVLSLENLKSLHHLIGAQLDQYESRFGAIRKEPGK
jgi:hypothetical protein